MQLNCNRAMGTWSAAPASDAISGTFRFGPLATTKALCPPPSMDERVARDAQWVRGYLLRDGMLHLSLMADAGIYSWEPVPAEIVGGEFATEPDPEIEEALRAAVPDYTGTIVGNGGWARYVYGRVDLNAYVRHRFDGTRYVESATLPAEPIPAGMRRLDGDYSYATGFPLLPTNET